MGEEYERELSRVHRARAEFEASQDEVERRKHEYFTSVRSLHEAGMPLREIASTLGLSHQRVHQMVDEASGTKRGRIASAARRVAKPSGLALAILLAAFGGYSVRAPSELPDQAERQARSAACRTVKLVFEDGTKTRIASHIRFDPASTFCLPDPREIFKRTQEHEAGTDTPN